MEELELREREKWVDAVKGLAIYLVILSVREVRQLMP